jgi:hypothetical protein
MHPSILENWPCDELPAKAFPLERVVRFELPLDLPLELLPLAVMQFLRDCVSGMQVDDLVQLAVERELKPTWKPIHSLGVSYYELQVTAEDEIVPILVLICI